MKITQAIDLGSRLAAAEAPLAIEPIYHDGIELAPTDAFFEVGKLIESLVPEAPTLSRAYENRRPGAQGSQVSLVIPNGEVPIITAQLYTDYLRVPHRGRVEPNNLLKVGEAWHFFGLRRAPGLDHFVKYSDIISETPAISEQARRQLGAIHDSVQIALSNRSLIQRISK